MYQGGDSGGQKSNDVKKRLMYIAKLKGESLIISTCLFKLENINCLIMILISNLSVIRFFANFVPSILLLSLIILLAFIFISLYFYLFLKQFRCHGLNTDDAKAFCADNLILLDMLKNRS